MLFADTEHIELPSFVWRSAQYVGYAVSWLIGFFVYARYSLLTRSRIQYGKFLSVFLFVCSIISFLTQATLAALQPLHFRELAQPARDLIEQATNLIETVPLLLYFVPAQALFWKLSPVRTLVVTVEPPALLPTTPATTRPGLLVCAS